MWPTGTIGPYTIGQITSPPIVPPPSPPISPSPSPPPLGPAGLCPVYNAALGSWGGKSPLVRQADLDAWGQGTPSLLTPPRDPVQFVFAETIDAQGHGNGGQYLLVDTLGVGFPPFVDCQPNIGTESWAQMQRDIAANTIWADMYPVQNITSPPPAPPPLPPPLPPGSPPPPPPPPPPLCPPPTIVCNTQQVSPPTCTPAPCMVANCDLSIAALAFYYPDFVIAERTAAKTDYDILYDAYTLGLCQGSQPQAPECSVPYLERVVPAFVLAAKAQGKSDVELLQDAIDIGLCVSPTQESIRQLGTADVESIAPGSEGVLASEFDPPPATPNVVATGAAGHCPPADFILPDWSQRIAALLPDDIKCLTGLDRITYGISLAVAGMVRQTCACPEGSFIDLMFQAAEAMKDSWGISGKVMGNITDFLGRVIRSVSCNLGVLDNYVQTVSGCGAGETAPIAILALLGGVWERWIGTLPQAWNEALGRTSNFVCPAGMPSQPEANIGLATNFLSQGEWECITRANGLRLDFQGNLVEMQRHRPTDDQLLILWRKYPQLQDHIRDVFRASGWTNDDWFNDYISSQDWTPAPTDAVQWMLKDVEDPQIQDTFKLRAEFGQKYKGHVKEVFDWNGISKQDADYIWRAHWRNMAPHTLYQMHKRLRPGYTSQMTDAQCLELALSICPGLKPSVTPDVLAARPVSNGFPIPLYCEEITNAVTARAWLESLVTGGYEVSEALGQDDYPPFWRARLLALSYNVMTRTDARRAYETSQIDSEALYAKLQDQGYSPTDALSLVGIYYNSAVQLHARRPLCNQYVKEGYDRELLKSALVSQGMRPEMWDDVFEIVNSRRNIRIQQQCVAGVRKQYTLFLISEVEATNTLLDLRIGQDDVAALITEWNCLIKSRSKQEAAGVICNEFRAGLITGSEAQRALRAAGYTAPAARRILSLCYLQTPPKTRRHRPIPGSPLDQAMQAALDS